MIKEYKCTCGEINPEKFYINQKSTCTKCRKKINKSNYKKNKKYIPMKKLSLLEKFTQGYSVNKSTGCWEWNKTIIREYGSLSFNSKSYSTHRLAYKLFNGEIPKDLIVRHNCNTKHCVNPEHLFLGTNADNMKDMVNKNRQAKGVKHGHNKLSLDEVQYIKSYPKYHGSGAELAEQFNVSRTAIYQIRNGNRWKHLD